VDLQGDRRVLAHTLVWTAGVTPNPVIARTDLRRGKHDGIVVDACCRVADRPGVWAIGDCAEIPMPGGQRTYAPTAQNTTREGKLVARNVFAVLGGGTPRSFTYRPRGELAVVGRHSAVASVYGVHFSGFLAWAMWRAIYLGMEPHWAKRLHVGLSWLLDLAVGPDLTELPGRHLPVAATTNDGASGEDQGAPGGEEQGEAGAASARGTPAGATPA
jgi:NADH dehydrogenase